MHETCQPGGSNGGHSLVDKVLQRDQTVGILIKKERFVFLLGRRVQVRVPILRGSKGGHPQLKERFV